MLRGLILSIKEIVAVERLIEEEIKGRTKNPFIERLVRDNYQIGHDLDKQNREKVAELQRVHNQIEAYDGHDAENEAQIRFNLPLSVKWIRNAQDKGVDVKAVFLADSGIDILPWIKEQDGVGGQVYELAIEDHVEETIL